MPIYHYEAVDGKGRVSRGTMDVASHDALMNELERKKLTPLSIEVEGGDKKKGGKDKRRGLHKKIKQEDRIVLVRNLGIMLKAGMGVLEALDILIRDTKKKRMNQILRHVKALVEKGQKLSDAFRLYPKDFSPVFLGLMQAGEGSGRLDEALEEAADQLTREYALVRKIRSALTYPVVLVVASILVVSLIVFFVLPRLTKAFLASNFELPGITRVLITVSNAITAHPIIDAGVAAFVIWFFGFFSRTRRGRQFFLRILMRMPIAGPIVKKIALVRFARNLGGLIASGLNILDALTLTAETIGNNAYKKKILASMDHIKNGVPLSNTLVDDPNLFPPLLVSMISVGETSGKLDFVLKTYANFTDEDVSNQLKDLTALIEPILIISMGLIIGTLALSILLPIYQYVGQFT